MICYCSSIADEYGIEIGGVNKLVPNLGIEDKYVLHYRNRQLYLSLRMKLTKVHRIQTNKRLTLIQTKEKNAASSFGKYFCKLMNNSVYGKTMENLRNNAGDYKNM